MNKSTLVAVCCYDGDKQRVIEQMPCHTRPGFPVVVLSPLDSPVSIPPHIARHAGRRAYIGGASLLRQLEYFRILLEYPHEFFLINDSDSFMLSRSVPERLYEDRFLWSNEVVEPRPHASPYPKLAFQPPYFLHRSLLTQMLLIGPNIPTHPITPYVDWFMNALSFEAGISHRPFTALEHEPRTTEKFSGTDPWKQLEYRIKFMGANFVHPIKTPEQVKLCRNARNFYEEQEAKL